MATISLATPSAACHQSPGDDIPPDELQDEGPLSERDFCSHLGRLESNIQLKLRTIEMKIDRLLTQSGEQQKKGNGNRRRASLILQRRNSLDDEPIPLADVIDLDHIQSSTGLKRKGLVHASGVPGMFLQSTGMDMKEAEPSEEIVSERPESDASNARSVGEANSECSAYEQRKLSRLKKEHALHRIENLPIQQRKRLTELMDFQNRVAVRDKFRGERADQLWQFLEETESSPAAQKFAHFMTLLILFSVVFTLLQTGDPPPLEGLVPSLVELLLDMIFSVEFALRWSVSPHKSNFVCSTFNIIDMTAMLFLSVRVFLMSGAGDALGVSSIAEDTWSILLCVVPVIRLLKLLRRFEKFQLLLHAFELALEALPVLLFTGAIILLVASSVIFLCEPRDNMTSLPRAMWLSIVTMTTVGYGDYSPKSTWGTMATSLLLVTSALYMAIPLGIVGNAFSIVWGDRDRLLLMQRTRKRLAEWGYTPRDIATFFALFSSQGDNTLTFRDFARMMNEMKLGLAEKRVFDLFTLFDDDGSGLIEPEEFVAILFPRAQIEFDFSSEEEHDHSSSMEVNHCRSMDSQPDQDSEKRSESL